MEKREKQNMKTIAAIIAGGVMILVVAVLFEIGHVHAREQFAAARNLEEMQMKASSDIEKVNRHYWTAAQSLYSAQQIGQTNQVNQIGHLFSIARHEVKTNPEDAIQQMQACETMITEIEKDYPSN